MRLALFLCVAGLLTACADYPTPTVDLQGKDPVQANRDLAACKNDTMRTGGFGNVTSRCMEKKGYTVLAH